MDIINIEITAIGHGMKSQGSNIKVVSVDMQKVLLLPQLPIKEAVFSRKLIVFNETFCDVVPNGSATCVLWHEEQAGRKAKNIASAYSSYVLKFCRDFQEIIFYADNCNAQNKNKLLLSVLALLVNDSRITAETMTIKFLEVGHTYMSADNVHAAISQKLRKSSNLHDFDDLKEMISNSRKRINTISLEFNEFWAFQMNDTVTRIRGLSDARVVQVRKGSFSVFIKQHFDEPFQEHAVFKKSVLKDLTDCDTGAPIEKIPRESQKRGISHLKKKDLLSLSKHMPSNRRQFFEDLKVSDVDDLMNVRELDF